MKKDLISILDLSETELNELIAEAGRLKEQRRRNQSHKVLEGKNLAMIFEKSSTRTRISFEVGMNELGGNALFLNAEDLQIGRGEEIRDTARVTSRYVSGVMIRAYRHETITDFARYSSVPVINGLSDREHPCQILADILTIKEHRGYTRGVKVAWVGDGDNVCNSFILASAITGMEVVVASPAGYLPPEDIVSEARARGGGVQIVSEPKEAVMEADVVVTDTWVSMGDEAEREARLKAFRGFSVTAELMDHAADDAIFMHCLPAHRGEEVTDEVIESSQSVVFDEAENRLHAQKALLVRLLGGEG
ncbi:MAG TPA: ornithine carbamoyltransferase [Methanoregulaceae archaeon]|nr:ornithine carbamoyltransferase [Methanolinea sp.]MDD3091277.1 ornithine carbamoyltransferase [Methanoregulaceae archaeon]MDD5048018.1 ornithine carbamoyltransferase [Methanoregulaceae archaeon]MDD5684444.1 ornithine carbamoyltransferase [Methanoregulaceae archaeon]HOP67013.1 ornithine carbamoyltransferase [Methanoregulaceae archaeon]